MTTRQEELVHNGSWFNRQGEKIGWGDLSRSDLATIQANLDEDDVFIVAPEHPSFWDAERLGYDPDNLPRKYVAEIARLAITKDAVFVIENEGDQKPGASTSTPERGSSTAVGERRDRAWLLEQMGPEEEASGLREGYSGAGARPRSVRPWSEPGPLWRRWQFWKTVLLWVALIAFIVFTVKVLM